MKNKLLYFTITIAVLVISVFASVYLDHRADRYHQHIEYTSEDFSSNLPIISINTNGLDIPINVDAINMLPVKISVINNSTNSNNLNNTPNYTESAKIKVRGNSSKYFDKNSYKLEFVNDDGTNKDVNLLDMGLGDEWILNAPFLDKTLIRNYMCLNIAGEIMDYAPEVRFCEVFINDNYMGVYVMMESITRSKDRINISGINEKLKKTGYILRLDRGGLEEKNINNFTKYTKKIVGENTINIEYPKQGKMTNELKSYIEKDLSSFEKSLYSFDYDDDNYGYTNYINVSSFVDYFIINEFFLNGDAGSYSTYLYKDIGGKYKLCVWDFNNACDNYMERSLSEEGFFMVDKLWYYMLVKDEDFIKRIIWRYKDLRKTVLSEEYLMKYIDDTVNFLGYAIDRNYEVWGYSFKPENLDSMNKLEPLERNVKSYEESILQLKTSIINRGNWLDNNIETLLQYCHESRTKKFNH